jgi:SpoVK/Ycf46/Vps4 family AAA+-type ATPase
LNALVSECVQVVKINWQLGGPLKETIEPKGIHSVKKLKGPEFMALWDSISVPQSLKESLSGQALLNFTLRPQIPATVIPLHGVILLVGPPGTGKTTLARGLASVIADAMKPKQLSYLEIEPHSLTSAAHGKTQKAVSELFGQTIAEYAQAGPTYVLLDEVETIIADRAKLSFDANPVDVHRATDAALVQLDYLGQSFPNLLIVATSNFPQAIDSAFISRCDVVLQVPLPDADACREILSSTLAGLRKVFPRAADLGSSSALRDIVDLCIGMDGRQIRKLVGAACASRRETALDPNKLTIEDLRRTAATWANQKQEVVTL